jgi:serine/threonine protein kinase
MAPEILNSKSYDYKVDMWSFGVSIYEALIGITPFGGKDKEDLRKNVNNGIVKFHAN